MPEIPPARTTSGTRSGDAFNRSVENARSHQPVSSPGARSGHTIHGTFHEVDDSGPSGYGGTSNGWRWATPKKYDKDISYSEGEVVVILPLDTIVTAGAASYESSGSILVALPGVWVALQSASPEDQGSGVFWYHIPRLPLPSETSIDSALNYWMQITSFC
jgi:hypothetical protein